MANMFYNGIELPALPEWDDTTYPVAVIIRCLDLNSTVAKLYGGEYVFAYGTRYDQPGRIVLLGKGGMFYTKDGAWVPSTYSESIVDVTYDYVIEPVWTNTDIVRNDGVVILEASEPTSGTNPDPRENMQRFITMLLAGLMSKGEIR